MFDKEIEAIAKCTEMIKELDDNSKFRVLKYLIERFGIANQQSNPNYTIQNSNLTTNFHDEEPIEHLNPKIDSKRNDYPTLKQILIKNLPKNETEWILCFAFYSSGYGEDTFKKEDIIERYKEANKYTENNRKNLMQNLNACIKKDWLKDYNKDEFILKNEGIQYVKEILTGNSTGKEVKRVKRNKNNSIDNE